MTFFASNVPNDAALTKVAELINELQPGSMVQRFVLMVETIDADNRWISGFVAPDQKAWDTMGMLQYAMEIESAAVKVGWESNDDDDDE